MAARPPASRAGPARSRPVRWACCWTTLSMNSPGSAWRPASCLTYPSWPPGAPWYFTLFGRDSLWAARLLLPLDAGLAGGTLRTLAEFQGTRHDPEPPRNPERSCTSCAPRSWCWKARARICPRSTSAPWIPLRFGCACLANWARGQSGRAVRALLPNAARAPRLVAGCRQTQGTGDGGAANGGFLSYRDSTGRGSAARAGRTPATPCSSATAGWRTGPMALAEVQGYAYQAAVATAELCSMPTRGAGEPGMPGSSGNCGTSPKP